MDRFEEICYCSILGGIVDAHKEGGRTLSVTLWPGASAALADRVLMRLQKLGYSVRIQVGRCFELHISW